MVREFLHPPDLSTPKLCYNPVASQSRALAAVATVVLAHGHRPTLASIPAPASPSSPHQPIQQRPSQHKATQPPKHVGSPQAGELRLEVSRRPALRQEEVDECGDEESAEEIEEEAGV